LKITKNQLGLKVIPDPQIFENQDQSKLENHGKSRKIKSISKSFPILQIQENPNQSKLENQKDSTRSQSLQRRKG